MESHHTKSPQHRVRKELWGRVSILSATLIKTGWREKSPYKRTFVYTILFVINGVVSFVFTCRLLFYRFFQSTQIIPVIP